MEPFIVRGGFIHGVLDGRAYVGPVAKGSAGDAAYHRLLGALQETGALAGMISGDGLQILTARAKLFLSADARALVRETLRGYTVDGISLDVAFDEAFAGRPWEPTAAALEIWMAQGFFTLPGAIPGKRDAPKPASPAGAI